MGKTNGRRASGGGAGLAPSFSGVSKPKGKKGSGKGGSSASGGSVAATGMGSLFKMNTDLGQHILKNAAVAQAIIAKAELKPSDTVLEIGPGPGVLTIPMLPHCGSVTVIELDPRMASELTKRLQAQPPALAKKVNILLGDAIKRPALPYCDILISNTPYQISSPLVFKLLAMDPPPRQAVLMFQREFALRLTAPAGTPLYSRLSANVALWADVYHVMKVGKGNFSPPPMVESSVVRIVPKRPRPAVDFDEWDGMLRVLFVRKNRTVRRSFESDAIIKGLMENWRIWCALTGTDLFGEAKDGGNKGSLADVPNRGLKAAISSGAQPIAGIDYTRLQQRFTGGSSFDFGDEDGTIAEETTTITTTGFASFGHDENENEDEDDQAMMDIDPVSNLTSMKPKSNKAKAQDPALYAHIKDKVLKVVEGNGLADRRVRSLDQNDLLTLLLQFNRIGLRFA